MDPTAPLDDFRPTEDFKLDLSKYLMEVTPIKDYETFMSNLSSKNIRAKVQGAIQGSFRSTSDSSTNIHAPRVKVYRLQNLPDAFKAVVDQRVQITDPETGIPKWRTLFEAQICDILPHKEGTWWIVGVMTATDSRFEAATGAQRTTTLAAQAPVGRAVATSSGVPNSYGVGDIEGGVTRNSEIQSRSGGTYVGEQIFGVAYCKALYQRRTTRATGNRETPANPTFLNPSGEKRPRYGGRTSSFKKKNVTTFYGNNSQSSDDEDEGEDDSGEEDMEFFLDLDEGVRNNILEDFLCPRFEGPMA
jgi:hypothetical protein